MTTPSSATQAQGLEVASLMGGGPQAILYSLMNSMLKTYSEIRTVCAQLAQSLTQAQSAGTTGASNQIKAAANYQSYQYYAEAGQSFGAAACSIGQLTLNRLRPALSKLSEEHNQLGTKVAKQQELLQTADEIDEEPMATRDMVAGNAQPPQTEEAVKDDVLNAKAKLMKTLEPSGDDLEAKELDKAAIRHMKSEKDGSALNEFREKLKAEIKHNQTLMTEKTQQLSYLREVHSQISQGLTNVFGGTAKTVSAVCASEQGSHNANKTLLEYVSQTSGSSVQTFTDSLRHYYDLVASLIQSTSAAARAVPQ